MRTIEPNTAHRRRGQHGKHKMSPLLKFYRYLNMTNIESFDNCWEWPRVEKRRGYGVLTKGTFGMTLPHRYMYQIAVDDLDPSLVINHLCRNHACVNPTHLEQVTQRVNIMAGIATSAINSMKEYCVNGHPLKGKNLKITVRKNGAVNRLCKFCWLINSRETHLRQEDRDNPNRERRLYRRKSGDYNEYYQS